MLAAIAPSLLQMIVEWNAGDAASWQSFAAVTFWRLMPALVATLIAVDVRWRR